MSGPKVVRTVTREELVEIAAVQLAIFHVALRRWQAEVSDTDNEAAARKLQFLTDGAVIEAAIATRQPEEIVRRTNVLIQSINQDIERLREAEFVQQARVATQLRSLRYMSRSLLKREQQTGAEIPAESRVLLKAAVDGQIRDCDQLAQVISRLLKQSLEADNQQGQIRHRALAEALQDGAPLTSASDLLKQLEAEEQDPRITIADRQIAELRKLGDDPAGKQFENRLAELIAQASAGQTSQFSLSLDSLGAELASRIRRARVQAELRRELEQEMAAAAVTHDTAACQADFDAIGAEIQCDNPESAREQLQSVREMLKARRHSRAANAARSAILDGLSQLGYTVQEGMNTSCADNRRLIIQHPSKTGLAVELAGNAESSRIQMRMVVVDGLLRSEQSDLDVESEWCQEFEQLQNSLAQSGNRTTIERAIPAGAQPLKVIANQWTLKDPANKSLQQLHRRELK